MKENIFTKFKSQNRKSRVVPAFSIQTLQNNTIVHPSPNRKIFYPYIIESIHCHYCVSCNFRFFLQKYRTDPYKINPIKRTLFRGCLDNGDIPIINRTDLNGPEKMRSKKKKASRLSLEWSVPLAKLNYCYYFPLIIEGLGDSDSNVRFIAESAAKEMIEFNPKKILPIVPLIILPIKRSMNTRDPFIIISILKIIQLMVKNDPCIGHALIPYFRHILPVCNLFKHINVNLLDGIDEERDRRIGDVIEDTLQILEMCGGRNAYINIKYVIPTFESCTMN